MNRVGTLLLSAVLTIGALPLGAAEHDVQEASYTGAGPGGEGSLEGNLGLGTHTFAPDPRPVRSLELIDATGAPVRAVVCQDVNEDGVCGEGDHEEPSVHRCASNILLRDAQPPFVPGHPITVNVLGASPGCPFTPSGGTLRLTFDGFEPFRLGICYEFDTAWMVVLDLGYTPAGDQVGGGVPVVVGGNGASPTTVCRSDVLDGPHGPYMETEILALDLVGHHPQLGEIEVRESPFYTSVGRIDDLHFDGQGRLCGSSWFDVFFEVTSEEIRAHTDDGWLRNHDPFRIGPNIICSLPPEDDGAYGKVEAGPVALFGTFFGDEFVFGFAVTGAHKVLPKEGPGVEAHALMAVADSIVRLTGDGCHFPILNLHVRDASVPGHDVTAVRVVSVDGQPPLTPGLPLWLDGPFFDKDGDDIWEGFVLVLDGPCASPTIEIEAQLADGHVARTTLVVPVV